MFRIRAERFFSCSGVRALDAGAEDFAEEEDSYEVVTKK